MNGRTTPYPDREIINRWAIAELGPGISHILSAKGLMRPDTDGCIGFFYVDHEEGNTFRIHSLCRPGIGRLPEIVVNFETTARG